MRIKRISNKPPTEKTKKRSNYQKITPSKKQRFALQPPLLRGGRYALNAKKYAFCAIKNESNTLSFCLRDWLKETFAVLPLRHPPVCSRDSPECHPVAVPDLAITWEVYSFGRTTNPSVFCNFHMAFAVYVYSIIDNYNTTNTFCQQFW